MYGRYRSNWYPRYSFGYPNYGNYGSPYYGGFGYNSSSRYNYNDYSSYDWNTYYYGSSRLNRYSWERDRNTNTSRTTRDSTPSPVADDSTTNRATGDNTTSHATGDNTTSHATGDNTTSRETRDSTTSRETRDNNISRAARERPRRAVTPPPIVPEDVPPIHVEPEVPKYELPTDLIVKAVNLHVEENAKKHRTDDYDCVEDKDGEDGSVIPGELVVRRGQEIKLTITFDRPYEDKKNNFQIGFSIGEKPIHSQGSKVLIDLDESGNTKFETDAWGANLESKSGKDINVIVHIPCNCIVGEWNLQLKTFSEGKDENGTDKLAIWEYHHNRDVTILFNPWCEDDGVFMRETNLLEEYVLNPTGCVFRGTPKRKGAKEWHYGQFDKDILDICLTLLRQGFLYAKPSGMSDPVKVSRIVAQIVNSAQDDGVLVGNWSGEYDDGVRPTKWAGSVKILRQWKKDGPVKYGQCWVFACLTTTVCRALGIPCRTVTNFSSAHDTDGSCTIDYYFDEAGNKDTAATNDSIWNFHCWNEVWLKRHDLDNKGMNGWQVIDATPQELSNGRYTLGPCPVAAVRKGLCATTYDSEFVFGEVNADKVSWLLEPDGDTTVTKIETASVGIQISTKVPDGEPYTTSRRRYTPSYEYTESRRMDITNTYKHIEGTQEERSAVMMSQLTTRRPWPGVYDHHVDTSIEKVNIGISYDDSVMVGQDLELKLTAKNGGNYPRTLSKIELTVYSKAYSGALGKRLMEKNFHEETVQKGEEKIFEATLKVEEYLAHIDYQGIVFVVADIVVDGILGGKDQLIEEVEDIRFTRPDLDVECPVKASKGEKVTFEVSFKNPLDETLTHCDISMESDGFDNLEDIKVNDVPPNSVFKETFVLVAKKLKRHTAVFSFDSRQLTDVTGSDSIMIVR